jgi:hypothetical protein
MKRAGGPLKPSFGLSGLFKVLTPFRGLDFFHNETQGFGMS